MIRMLKSCMVGDTIVMVGNFIILMLIPFLLIKNIITVYILMYLVLFFNL